MQGSAARGGATGRQSRRTATIAVLAAAAVTVLAAGGGCSLIHPNVPTVPTTARSSVPPSSTTTPMTVPPTVPTTAPATTTTTAPLLSIGSSGPAVLAVQQRLSALGYWLGVPDGTFGDSTQQAVFALQKAAGLTPDGVVGPETTAAPAAGVVPSPRPQTGYGIQIDLTDDLVMFVTGTKLEDTLNTSTGGGYTYVIDGQVGLALTPTGHFSIYRTVDGETVSPLGVLWRPRYFDDGYAIHGDTDVPSHPVSHGCVRVSDEAIDWIWADDLAPIGTPVWIY